MLVNTVLYYKEKRSKLWLPYRASVAVGTIHCSPPATCLSPAQGALGGTLGVDGCMFCLWYFPPGCSRYFCRKVICPDLLCCQTTTQMTCLPERARFTPCSEVSTDQQHQHHLGPCQKCRPPPRPHPAHLNQYLHFTPVSQGVLGVFVPWGQTPWCVW